MKQKRVLSSFVIITLLSLVIVFSLSCGKGVKTEEAKIIKIGAILPLTGSLSFIGEVQERAVEIYKKELINTNIQIVLEDAKSDKKESATIANKWTLKKDIPIFLTTTTGLSRTILPFAVQNKKLFVSLCMDFDIQNESPYSLRFYYSFLQEGEAILNSVMNLGWDRVGIIHLVHSGVQRELESVIIPGLKNNGVSIDLIENYELQTMDFKQIISKLKSKNIKNVILLGYGNEYANIFKTIEEYKLLNDIKILGGYGFIYRDKMEIKWLEKVLFVAPENLAGDRSVNETEFYKEFQLKYNSSPHFDALFLRDALDFLKKEIIENNYNIEKIVEKINKNDIEFEGILGKYLIKKGGDLRVNLSLFSINKDGEIALKEKDVAKIQ
jgi:ABC-type branched-subunit amino acid transport system substrate-binding protein